jgi:hypothetical protein
VTAPPQDTHRLFVVQRLGLIKIIVDGAPQAEPFLDISSLVSQDPELGILSIAFAPDYATSRKFYVYYTAVGTRAVTLAQFLRDEGNPNIADPSSRRTLLTIPHPQPNHNGGQLQFGPDGYLYMADGDAGGQNDPYRNGQNLETLPGKLMRIDPFRGEPYAIPPNNPFVGQPPKRPEIFAYGFRNPWRFSFDRLTGDLTLGDVGQNLWEEIDFAPLASGGGNGANFGWSCWEATHIFRLNLECNPPPVQVPPVFEYPHGARGCSITGGYVVRDPGLPSLQGRYLFGDYCTGQTYTKALQSMGDDVPTGLPAIAGLASFGEDACGHIYALSNTNGSVYRVRDTSSPPPSCTPAFPRTLTADVNPDFTIHLKDREGRELDGRTLPPGTYTVAVDDNAGLHNFHLFGDAVECVAPSTCSTDISGSGHEVWTVNLRPGTATYRCDAHSSTMHGTFTVAYARADGGAWSRRRAKARATGRR